MANSRESRRWVTPLCRCLHPLVINDLGYAYTLSVKKMCSYKLHTKSAKSQQNHKSLINFKHQKIYCKMRLILCDFTILLYSIWDSRWISDIHLTSEHTAEKPMNLWDADELQKLSHKLWVISWTQNCFNADERVDRYVETVTRQVQHSPRHLANCLQPTIIIMIMIIIIIIIIIIIKVLNLNRIIKVSLLPRVKIIIIIKKKL